MNPRKTPKRLLRSAIFTSALGAGALRCGFLMDWFRGRTGASRSAIRSVRACMAAGPLVKRARRVSGVRRCSHLSAKCAEGGAPSCFIGEFRGHSFLHSDGCAKGASTKCSLSMGKGSRARPRRKRCCLSWFRRGCNS